MHLISVWREGYSVTGNQGTAEFIGSVTGDSFEQVVRYLSKDEKTGINYNSRNIPNIWGCKLFDNEADARKSFG